MIRLSYGLLPINLEPAILASADGHRWAQGAEAVERCEARGTPLHIRLAKAIALIDLFRNGTGIVAERDIVRASLADVEDHLVTAHSMTSRSGRSSYSVSTLTHGPCTRAATSISKPRSRL